MRREEGEEVGGEAAAKVSCEEKGEAGKSSWMKV